MFNTHFSFCCYLVQVGSLLKLIMGYLSYVQPFAKMELLLPSHNEVM